MPPVLRVSPAYSPRRPLCDLLSPRRAALMLATGAAGATLLAATPLAAQETGSADAPYVLPDIVLGAGLTPLAGAAYGRANSIATPADFDAEGSSSVADALSRLPGLSVSAGSNGLTQLRIRGGEGNHTLVLIDGIEAAGGADEYYFSGLDLANVARIEVLRGPQTVFYGSNASSGVVNIITRGAEPGLHYGAALELGDGASGSAYVTRRGDRGGVALLLSGRDDHGFDESGDGGERDGRIARSATLKGDVAVTPDLRLGGQIRRAHESFDRDSENYLASDPAGYIVDDPFPRGDKTETQTAIWGEYDMAGGRVVQRLEWQRARLETGDNSGYEDRFSVETLKYRGSIGLDGTAADADHLLNVLAERQRDQSDLVRGNRRDMRSVAVEYRARLAGGVDLQAGLRRDDNRQFSDFTGWTLAGSWQVPDRPFRVHASAGSGQVNPSYFELYADADYGSAIYRGNPRLRPEQNRSVDLGVETQLPGGWGTLDVTLFRERLTDEVDLAFQGSEGAASVFSYVNRSGDSPRQGVEVQAFLTPGPDTTVRLAYTYLDAETPEGTAEIRRPRHEASVAVSQLVAAGRGEVSADLRVVSDLYDSQSFGAFTTERLPSYTLVGVSAGYDLRPGVRLTGRIANLLDRDHTDVWGYAGRGRTAYLGLRADF